MEKKRLDLFTIVCPECGCEVDVDNVFALEDENGNVYIRKTGHCLEREGSYRIGHGRWVIIEFYQDLNIVNLLKFFNKKVVKIEEKKGKIG